MKTVKCTSLLTILSLALLMPNAHAVKNGEKFKSWKGKCEKVDGKEFCGVTHTVFNADKKPIVNIFIRKIDDKSNPLAFVKVPLGVNLQAGLGLAVDKKEIAQVPYTVCDPAGCNAIFPLSKEVLGKMQKGKVLQVGMFLVNQEVIMEASLSGFTKAVKAL